MMPKKSKYRIVPTTNEKFGACWALKEGEIVLLLVKNMPKLKKVCWKNKLKKIFF